MNGFLEPREVVPGESIEYSRSLPSPLDVLCPSAGSKRHRKRRQKKLTVCFSVASQLAPTEASVVACGAY